MAIDFTYEKNNLAEFLDELPSLVLQYQQMQLEAEEARALREQSKAEREEDVAWRESQAKVQEDQFERELKVRETEQEFQRQRQIKEFEETMRFEEKMKRLSHTMDLEKYKIEREGDVSDIFLQNAMGTQDILNQTLISKKAQASELGLVNDALDKLSDEHKTKVSKLVTDQSMGVLTDVTNSLTSQIDIVDDMIADYNQGLIAAGNMDINNDKIITSDELSLYTDDPAMLTNESFMHGINKYSSDAVGRIDVQQKQRDILMTDAQLEIAKKEAEKLDLQIGILPRQLQNQIIREGQEITLGMQAIDLGQEEITLTRQKIAEGKIDIDLKQATYEELADAKELSKETIRAKKIENNINDLKLTQLEKEMAQTDDIFDRERAQRQITALQEILQSNNDKKADVATAILANISIGSNPSNGVYQTMTPFYSIITDPEATTQKIEKEFKDLPNIASELKGLHSAFAIGKNEEQVADFDIVLKQLSDIKGYGNDYKLFEEEYGEQLKNARGTIIYIKPDGEPIYAPTNRGLQDILDNSDMSEDRKLKIKKAVEWNSTGIFDNNDLDVIEQILEQERLSKGLIEQIQLNDLFELPAGSPDIPRVQSNIQDIRK